MLLLLSIKIKTYILYEDQTKINSFSFGYGRGTDAVGEYCMREMYLQYSDVSYM